MAESTQLHIKEGAASTEKSSRTKEFISRRLNKHIKVVAVGHMTTDQQASFMTAIHALLVDLIKSLDRRDKGEADGEIEA